MFQHDLKKDYFGGTKIYPNGHLRDLGLSWDPDGGPDSQNYQNDLQNAPRDTQISPKTTPKTILGWEARRLGKQNIKKWRAFPPARWDVLGVEI